MYAEDDFEITRLTVETSQARARYRASYTLQVYRQLKDAFQTHAALKKVASSHLSAPLRHSLVQVKTQLTELGISKTQPLVIMT